MVKIGLTADSDEPLQQANSWGFIAYTKQTINSASVLSQAAIVST